MRQDRPSTSIKHGYMTPNQASLHVQKPPVERRLLDANAVLAVDPGLQLAVTVVELDADTVVQDLTVLATLDEVILKDVGETPEAGGIDLLAASNLVLGTAESLHGILAHVLAA